MNSNKIIKIFQNISLVDLYPVQFGYEKCSPTHVVPLSKFRNYILHYIISGKGYVHVESLNREVRLKNGQAFLFEPDILSSYRSDSNDPWEYFWIEFQGTKAKNYLQRAGLNTNNQIYTINDFNNHEKIIKRFENLLQCGSEDDIGIIGHTYLLLSSLIRHSSNSQAHVENMTKNFYVKEAIKYISRYYNQNITIQDVANHCNINRTYLTRLFRDELNITPSDLLTKTKLSNASELLVATNLSIADIAERVGYSNQFIFSTAFKKEYSVPPSRWRQLNQSN